MSWENIGINNAFLNLFATLLKCKSYKETTAGQLGYGDVFVFTKNSKHWWYVIDKIESGDVKVADLADLEHIREIPPSETVYLPTP